MIISNVSELKNKCTPVESLSEGEDIAVGLLNEITKSKSAIGLAANQIGINKRVCVINVMDEPVILINPKILDGDGEIYMEESCLSFPNRTVKTKRFEYITIECDNLGKVMFGPTGISDDIYSESQKLQVLESICVQHEVDHLDGITMFDRAYKIQPIINKVKKIGRNQKVKITNGTETKSLKWKKAEKLIEHEDAEWSLVLNED